MRSEKEQILTFDQEMISPRVATEKLLASERAASITTVRVVELFSVPHYEIGYRSKAGAEEFVLANAVSGEMRMRSMAARASDGSVSHVGERDSHSLGPREP